MFDAALREKPIRSHSLEEVEKLISKHPDLDAKRVYQEIEKHRPGSSEKLDLSELEAVSGGADRNWAKDGCAATCEENSWCWSNDKCQIWDVSPTKIPLSAARMAMNMSIMRLKTVAPVAATCGYRVLDVIRC